MKDLIIAEILASISMIIISILFFNIFYAVGGVVAGLLIRQQYKKYVKRK